jgi:hypothetical protein
MTLSRESVENSVEKHHEIARKDLTKLHAIFVVKHLVAAGGCSRGSVVRNLGCCQRLPQVHSWSTEKARRGDAGLSSHAGV